jgi:hypothetical protein
VITSGLRLVLAPLVLLAAAVIASGLQSRPPRLTRWIGIGACAAAMGLLISDLGVVIAQGAVEASLGSPVAGTSFLFRADSTGAVLAMLATGAALCALLEPPANRSTTAALLLCAAGSCGAALGGNAVMLFAGLEVSNAASMCLVSRGARLSRGAVAAFAAQHLASLGLLGAAVQLTVSTGTSDLAAVPAGAVTAAVALPWALAGVARLLAPALASFAPGGSWAAVGAVPSGAAVMLRLRSFSGPLPDSVIVVLAVAGALIALWGAVLAGRASSQPARAGRGLLLIDAGLAVAVVGMNVETAGLAAAASLLALELSVAVAPLWSRAGASPAGRWLAAIGIAAAGNLPIGLGTSALVLTLGAAASVGLAGLPLVAALGVAAAVGVGASLRAARILLAAQGAADAPRARRPLAAVAVLASGAAALLPGAAGALVIAPLAGSGATLTADAAALRGLQGGWAGGYFAVAAAWLAVVTWSGSMLVGRTATRPVSLPAIADRRTPNLAGLLRLRHGLGRPVGLVLNAATALDQWLVEQPRLPMLLIAAALAVIFLH